MCRLIFDYPRLLAIKKIAVRMVANRYNGGPCAWPPENACSVPHAGPSGSDRPDAGPAGKPHARYAHLEKALMLKEVPRPAVLDRGIMDGALPGHLGLSKPTARHKVHGNRRRPGPGIESHIPYTPGCPNA